LDPSNAFLILGIKEAGDPEDAYEEAVFTQASFFMRRAFLPKLARARIQRLQDIQEAAKALNLNLDKESAEIPVIDEPLGDAPPAEWVKWYNQQEGKVKKPLANTRSAREAIALFEIWITVFEFYRQGFISGFEKYHDPSASLKNVKLAEASVFTTLAGAQGEEREKILLEEYSRLKRLSSD
jgi:hypothetical protein